MNENLQKYPTDRPTYELRTNRQIPDSVLEEFWIHWENLYKGKLLIFLGAGASIGAKNAAGRPLPSAYELRNSLWRKFMLTNEQRKGYNFDNLALMSLEHASALVEQAVGRNAVMNFVREEFSVPKPPWQHVVLYFLEPRAIFTTNYDMLIEQGWNYHAKTDNFRRLVPVHAPDSHISPSCVRLFKPHGSVDEIDETGENGLVGQGGVVITQFDYFSMLNSKKQLVNMFANLESEFGTTCAIFIGYSFLDSDIGSILYGRRHANHGTWWYAVFPRNDARVRNMYLQHFWIQQMDRTFYEFLVDLDEKINFIPEEWKAKNIPQLIKNGEIQT
jgi:hypothetical protein